MTKNTHERNRLLDYCAYSELEMGLVNGNGLQAGSSLYPCPYRHPAPGRGLWHQQASGVRLGGNAQPWPTHMHLSSHSAPLRLALTAVFAPLAKLARQLWQLRKRVM
jgi:hypothetical protein